MCELLLFFFLMKLLAPVYLQGKVTGYKYLHVKVGKEIFLFRIFLIDTIAGEYYRVVHDNLVKLAGAPYPVIAVKQLFVPYPTTTK